jgi:hypothetical protein
MGTPTRSTTEADLDQWNQAMRASPLYQNFLKKNGLVDTGRGVTMSRAQQSALEDELEAAGIDIPGGMHIDQGGNLNQQNRLGRNLAIGAGAAGAAFGIPAILGAGGAAGAAGGAGGGLLPSSAIGSGMAGLAPTVTGGATGAGMGFWSGLGNVGKSILGLGGEDGNDWGGLIGNLLSAGGKAATGASQAAADARLQELLLGQSGDRLKQTNAQILENALMNRGNLDLSQQGLLENAKQGRAATDLAQRSYALNAPSTRAGQSVRGDIMANAQDASISHPRATIPQMSGGLKPSLFSENTRNLGQEMSRKALADQMAGDTFADMGDLPTFKAVAEPTIPTLTQPTSGGAGGTVLNTIGTAGTILDLLRQAGIMGGEDEDDKGGNAAASALPGLFGNLQF